MRRFLGILVDFGAYAAVLAFAISAGWKSGDFVWAFWISGIFAVLFSGAIAPFFAIPGRLAAGRHGGERATAGSLIVDALGNAVGMGGATAFILIPLLFGFPGYILNKFIPLVPSGIFQMQGGELFGVWALVEEAASRFWPLAAAVCIARAQPIAAAGGGSHLTEVSGTIALVEVLRSWVVIFIAVLLQMTLGALSKQAATYANYVLLAVFLFPWKMLVDFSVPSNWQKKN